MRNSFPHTKLIPKSRFLVDAFSLSGDLSVSYFLSHYTGLTTTWSKGLISCFPITARLLLDVLNMSPHFLVPLLLNHTVLVDRCKVALIDSNHRPGAVKFLFKIPVVDAGGSGGGKKFERYVHTDDFRHCDDVKLVSVLGLFVGCDAVFLDTTYCNPKFVFPSQEESIDYVVSVVESVGAENRGDDEEEEMKNSRMMKRCRISR